MSKYYKVPVNTLPGNRFIEEPTLGTPKQFPVSSYNVVNEGFKRPLYFKGKNVIDKPSVPKTKDREYNIVNPSFNRPVYLKEGFKPRRRGFESQKVSLVEVVTPPSSEVRNKNMLMNDIVNLTKNTKKDERIKGGVSILKILKDSLNDLSRVELNTISKGLDVLKIGDDPTDFGLLPVVKKQYVLDNLQKVLMFLLSNIPEGLSPSAPVWGISRNSKKKIPMEFHSFLNKLYTDKYTLDLKRREFVKIPEETDLL